MIPIDPATVSQDTPLSNLNLNWTEAQLPQALRTRHTHGIHPYLGKYPPQLAEVFLRKFFRPGQVVIDPFVGSGTTLIQANELGIESRGYDVSAFNCLLSQVKTDDYDLRQVANEASDILQRTGKALGDNLGQASLANGLATDNDYLRTWYAPKALAELITFRSLILSGGYRYQGLLQIILTRAARSARLTTHFDLDSPKRPQDAPYYCYKHSRTCQPTQEAYKFLARYTKDTLHRLGEWQQVRTEANISICHADSRYVDPPEGSGVITSPPYVGLIDYHAQHEYAYHLLGLCDNRGSEIGSAAQGASKTAILKYKEDITQVISNVMERLPRNAPIIIVASDKHSVYPDIAQRLGVYQDAVIQRAVTRRTGRRSGDFYESIFVWRKP